MAPDGSPRRRPRLGLVPLSAGEEELYARRDEAAQRRRRLLAVRAQERQAAQLVTRRYRDNLARLRGRKAQSASLELRARHEQLVAELYDQYQRSLAAVGSAQRGAREKLLELLQQADAEARKWSFNDQVVAKQRSGEAARAQDEEERRRLARRLEAEQNLAKLRDLGNRQRAQASEHARNEQEALEKRTRMAEEKERIRRENAPEVVVTLPRPHGKDVVSYRLTRLHCLSEPADQQPQSHVKVVRHNTRHPSAFNGIDEAAKFRDEVDKRLEQMRQMNLENLETANARGARATNTLISQKEGDKVMEWLASIDELERKHVSPPIDTGKGFHPQSKAPMPGSGAMKEFEHLFQIDEDDSGAISVFSAGTEEESVDESALSLGPYPEDVSETNGKLQVPTRTWDKLDIPESPRRHNIQGVIKYDGMKDTDEREISSTSHKADKRPKERLSGDSEDHEQASQTRTHDVNPASDDESADDESIENLEDRLQDVLNLRLGKHVTPSLNSGTTPWTQHSRASGQKDDSPVFSPVEEGTDGDAPVSSYTNLHFSRMHDNARNQNEQLEDLHRDTLRDRTTSPTIHESDNHVDRSVLSKGSDSAMKTLVEEGDAGETDATLLVQSRAGGVVTAQNPTSEKDVTTVPSREGQDHLEINGHGSNRGGSKIYRNQADLSEGPLNDSAPDALSRSMLSENDVGSEFAERQEGSLHPGQTQRISTTKSYVQSPLVWNEAGSDALANERRNKVAEESPALSTEIPYSTQMSESRRNNTGSSVAPDSLLPSDVHSSFNDSASSHSSIGFAVQLALATGTRRRKTGDRSNGPQEYSEEARTRGFTSKYDRRYSSSSSISTSSDAQNGLTPVSETLPLSLHTSTRALDAIDVRTSSAPMRRENLAESRSSSGNSESLSERLQHARRWTANTLVSAEPAREDFSRFSHSRSSWSSSESGSDAFIKHNDLRMRSLPAPPLGEFKMSQPPPQARKPTFGGTNMKENIKDITGQQLSSSSISSSSSSSSKISRTTHPPSQAAFPGFPASQSLQTDMSRPPAPAHTPLEERKPNSSSSASSYEGNQAHKHSIRSHDTWSDGGVRLRLSRDNAELMQPEGTKRRGFVDPSVQLLDLSQPPARAQYVYEQYSIVSDSTDAFGSHAGESLSDSRRSSLQHHLHDIEVAGQKEEEKEDNVDIRSSLDSSDVLLMKFETMQRRGLPAPPALGLDMSQPPAPKSDFFEQYSIISDSTDAFGSRVGDESNDIKSDHSSTLQQQLQELEGDDRREVVHGGSRSSLSNSDALKRFEAMKRRGLPAPPTGDLDLSQPPAPVNNFFEQYSIVSDSTDAFGSHFEEGFEDSESNRSSHAHQRSKDYEVEEQNEKSSEEEVDAGADADDADSRSSLSSSDSIMMKFQEMKRRGLPAPPARGLDMSQPPIPVKNFFEQYSIISDSTDAFGSHADEVPLNDSRSDHSIASQQRLEGFEDEEKKEDDGDVDDGRSSHASSRGSQHKAEDLFIALAGADAGGGDGSLAEAFQKRHPRFHLRAEQHREQAERKRQAQLARQQQGEEARRQEKADAKDPNRRLSSSSSATDAALTEEKAQLLSRLASGARVKVSEREMKERSRRLYQQLPEVVERRRQEEVLRRRRERLNELREQEKARRLAQRERQLQRAKQ